MADILDSIDELDDVNEVYEPDSVEDPSNELLVNETEDILELDDLNDMTENEAQAITDAIRSTVTATYDLLERAHEGKAYKALGYETWKEYILGEFDFSAQRSYQLLDLSKTVKAIEAAAPEGYEAVITEAQARDIKRELPKITQRIEEETEGKTAEESSEIIDEIIDENREQKKAEEKALAAKEKKKEEEELEAEQAELEKQADDLLAPDSADGVSDEADSDYFEVDVAGDGSETSPRDAMSIYNFFNIFSSFDTLPDPEDMLALIPQDREDEVEQTLLDLTGWFNSFHTLWQERKSDD